MARRLQASPPAIPAGLPEHIDPAKTYRVQLLTSVQVGSAVLAPVNQHLMTGAVLSEVKDAVYGAVDA